jgi:CBS domain-containing protein
MATLRQVLAESRVLDLGPLPAPRLPPQATLEQALPFLARGRRGAIVVVDGQTPLGIFTERDVIARLPAGLLTSRDERARTALSEVMSQPVVAARRQETLAGAIGRMVQHGMRHLVIVDRHGDLRGLLTTSDVVQFLTDRFPEDTVNLPPRLHQQYGSREGA